LAGFKWELREERNEVLINKQNLSSHMSKAAVIESVLERHLIGNEFAHPRLAVPEQLFPSCSLVFYPCSWP